MFLENMFYCSYCVFCFFLCQFRRFKTALQNCSKFLEFRNFTKCLCIFLRDRFNWCRWFSASFRFLSGKSRSGSHFSQCTKSLSIGFFFCDYWYDSEIEGLCEFLRGNV